MNKNRRQTIANVIKFFNTKQSFDQWVEEVREAAGDGWDEVEDIDTCISEMHGHEPPKAVVPAWRRQPDWQERLSARLCCMVAEMENLSRGIEEGDLEEIKRAYECLSIHYQKSLSNRPVRVQRKRTKGWKMPENTCCVTRPGKFGNPFETAAEFREWMALLTDGKSPLAPWDEQAKRMKQIVRDIGELRGKNLACFCPLDADCHADVLLEYANRPEDEPSKSLTAEKLESICESIVGQSVDAAKLEAERAGCSIRVMKIDGKNCIGTCDYKPSRINVAVADGKIIEITGRG